MEKLMKSKGTNSKRMKTKLSSTSVGVDQDIAGLLTALVQKLTSFETKIDAVLSWISLQSSVAPRQQPLPVPSTERHREPRIMHKVICADCKKECEVPFKPSGDRPVYCKECFSRRKAGNQFKARMDNRPKEAAPVQTTNIDQSRVSEKKKPVAKKKSVKKKKPVSKKRKKK
ncbi:CxxC-x17-CxxC domain-containing protein [Candidatus Omnitrophota bacterium]